MIRDYPWESAALLAAELRGDGTVVRANETLERFAGRAVEGASFEALVVAAQRGAFRERLAEADEHWRRVCFALQGEGARPASDRELWMRRREGVVMLIGEPAVGEQERLVEKVLELNDDLVAAHRELVEQREALREAADRIRHLEAISSAGLAHLRLDEVLDEVLGAIAAAVGAERASILLPEGPHGRLQVRAAVGSPGIVGAAIDDVALGGKPQVEAGAAAVPLMLDGSVVGVLEVGRGDFGDSDLALLLPAAERAAVAISRARLHERERRIAETLQRALLPDRLPLVEGLSMAARFEPGAAAVEVGGDWYDALPLPTGEVAVAIGDVAGKGVRAAALMGEMRSGLRAYALDGGDPHEVLARLNALVLRTSQMATVLLAVVDPAAGVVRYASAGHLPPLLVAPDGSVSLLEEGRGAPLLVYRSGAGSGSVELEPGAKLVLYTDGLVERRGEAIDDGLDRLAAAAVGLSSVEETCDHLLEAMHMPDARDDVAVLAVGRA